MFNYILNTGTRLTLVTEYYYIFHYKDHWDPGLFNMLHITLISSNGVVYLDLLLDVQLHGIVSLDQLMGTPHTRTYLIMIISLVL